MAKQYYTVKIKVSKDNPQPLQQDLGIKLNYPKIDFDALKNEHGVHKCVEIDILMDEITMRRVEEFLHNKQEKIYRERTPRQASEDQFELHFNKKYLLYPDIVAAMVHLRSKHRDKVKIEKLPHLSTGEDWQKADNLKVPQTTLMLRVSNDIHNDHKEKPALLVIAGVHGNEMMNPLICLDFATHLLENTNQALRTEEILEHCEVFIIPVVNPDGLNYAAISPRKIGSRKNRHRYEVHSTPDINKPNSVGIDPNRGFSIGHEAAKGRKPDAQRYAGENSMVESENRNLEYVLETFDNIKVVVDLHSCSKSELSAVYHPNYDFISNMELRMSKFEKRRHLESQFFYLNVAKALKSALNRSDVRENEKALTFHESPLDKQAGTSHYFAYFEHNKYGFLIESNTGPKPKNLEKVSHFYYKIIAGLKAILYNL